MHLAFRERLDYDDCVALAIPSLARAERDPSMPLGEYDAVDPELAQFDYLPVPNVPEVGDYSVHSGCEQRRSP